MKELTGCRISRLLLTFLLVSVILPVSMFAQAAGYGTINGTVLDPSGAVLSGAKVSVDNASKGIHRELVSSGAGFFSAPALVPAEGYTVTISASGFNKYEVKPFALQVGETITIDAKLRVASGETKVEVTDQAPLVDFSKTDTSAVVGSQQLLDLPINGRRVDQFVLLTPGVTNDAAFGLLSFRGNPGGNSFLTDGIDTTNSYYGENAGRTRTYNISQDAVQEFQVVSANFAAEYGKASGGVVNTVTRSGSNSFHGSAYEFFRNRTLSAIDRTTVNAVTPDGVNPPEWRHQAGLSVGGPIQKDKLFFFFNGELFRRNAPAVSSNFGAGAGNNLFDGSDNYKSGQACVPTNQVLLPGATSYTSVAITQAQCDAANNWVKGRTAQQMVPRKMDNNLLFLKLDYHPNSKDSISINGNYLDFRSPNGIQTQVALTNGSALGNNADTNVFDRTGRLSWTRVINGTSINEARFGIFKDRQVDPASASLLPTFGAAGPATVALTINSVSNLGYATNYPRENPSELRLQWSDTYSKIVGKHNMKFGADVTRLEDYVISMPNQYPTYTYSATSAKSGNTTLSSTAMTLFALDFNKMGYQGYTGFSETVGKRVVNYALWETSLFAQDEWHVTPKLSITPGIRYEYTAIPSPGQGSSTVAGCNPSMDAMIQAVVGNPNAGTCKIPGFSGAFAPRLGVAYAVNSKTAIRGGYGIFQDRYTTSTIENLLVTTGTYQKSYSYSSITAAQYATLPTFPAVEPWTWAPNKTISPDIFFADPKYRNPYSQQATVAIEREVAKNTSLSVSYVWSRSLHINVSKDTNVSSNGTTLQYRVLNAAGQLAKTSPTYTGYTGYNSAYGGYSGRVSELQSAGNSYYNALLVNLNTHYSNWFSGAASYTYGHTIDYNIGYTPTFGSTTPTSFYNENYKGTKGSSNLDRRHNLVVNATLTPKFTSSKSAFAKYAVNGWSLSIVDQAASGEPVAPGYTTVSGSTLSYCTAASCSSTVTPKTTASLLRSGLNGLGNSVIPFESLSALNLGAIFRTDARLSKAFPVTEHVNVTLGLEAVNLFNHLIVSGRNSTMYTLCNGTSTSAGCTSSMLPTLSGGTTVMTMVPYSAYGALSATQITPDGTTARRAQAVARITF